MAHRSVGCHISRTLAELRERFFICYDIYAGIPSTLLHHGEREFTFVLYFHSYKSSLLLFFFFRMNNHVDRFHVFSVSPLYVIAVSIKL